MSGKFSSLHSGLAFTFATPLRFGALFAAGALLASTGVLAQSDGKDLTPRHGPLGADKITGYPKGVFHVAPLNFGVTSAVRDLPTSVPNAAELVASAKLREVGPFNKRVIKPIIPGAGAGVSDFKDPLVDRSRAFIREPAMPTPTLTFDGASQVDNAVQGLGNVVPPDVNGDVGLNHYVSSVNLVYKIFNKNGTVAAGPFRTNALFSGLPATDPCRTQNAGDPIVVYDSLADRWHISQFAVPGFNAGSGTNYQCIALSVSGDPTGSYYVWSYPYPIGALNDYPKVGVWTDAYHMTFNQFDNATQNFVGMGILSQDRPKALAGNPAASVVFTNIASIDPGAGGGLPADIDGFVPPPAGMAVVIAEFRSDEAGDPLDAIRYYRWVPNFVTPGSSSISVLPDVALAPFDARAPATRQAIEVSGGVALDALSDRLMHRFAYRNLGTQAAPVNSFVGNFTVNVSGVNPTTAGTYQAGIRWFEMRRSGDSFSVFDQGTHNLTPGNGATGLNNWMGSIAQDYQGNLALGFSQASTTQQANIKIAGRTINTANSGILNEGESVFQLAGGAQTSTSGRWGDYSAMNVDPVDDCTFWYTQEYYPATNTAAWSTRVGSFKFPSCTVGPKATIQGTITNCANAAPINLASVDATGGFNRSTVAAGTYSMTVAPGTYTVTASKLVSGFAPASQAGVTVANGATATVNLCLTPSPILAAAGATLISESFSPANGVIDPGETVTVSFGAQNIGSANTINDVGTLAASGGVTAPVASANYGVIVAGGPVVNRNITFTASPALACGANITANVAHLDGASNLGSLTYSLATGAVGAATTFSYTGPPVAIPDNNAAGVDIPLVVTGFVGNISDVNFRLDALPGCSTTAGDSNASVTHTFLGDLRFKLTSPAGTTVSLIANRGVGGNNFCTVTLDDDGGFPSASTIAATGAITGNFAPETPLSAFDGQNANGTWTLNVSDTAALDVGTLNRFSLIIAGRACAAPPVTVTNVTSSTANGTYSTGAVIPIQVSFSDIVTVTGTPQLALNSGGTASYASGSGTNTLTLNYTVGAGQSAADLDYTSTSALTGTINGPAAAAVLTLPAPGAAGSLGANKDIVIATVSDLAISLTHVGNFSQGGTGTYTATVNNIGPGDKPAATLVTVTEAPPAGMTVTAMSGTGWTCTTLPNCTRSDVLTASSSYAAITVTVAIAANATSPLLNSASVTTAANDTNAGNNTVNDATVIVQPDLTIAKTHTGNFTQGQSGATYTVVVTNLGAGDKLAATLVTVTDNAPSGLTVTAMAGGGWTCTTLPNCTRNDVLTIGASYPAITVTVSVAGNATSPLVNSATVSTAALESNNGNNSANASTVIIAPPDLTVTKTHTGDFIQGQVGATYLATVTNSGAGSKVAAATVSLTDTAPTGLTITAMSGTGWICTTLPTCTRNDVLPAAASYPPVTITVTVAANATSPLVNSVAVTTTAIESNTGNNSANDSTVIVVPPDLQVTKSHTGNFTQGQIGATYLATVSNTGAGPKLAGDLVTLTDNAPSGLIVTAMSGVGWTCATLPTCTRSDSLSAGASYAPVTITVTVATNATSPKVNNVTVSTTGPESNTGNNSASDSTVILVPPDLTLSKTHVGDFSQGQTGATYLVTVSNVGLGAKLASDVVTVTDTVPAGLTITAMSGTGWTCTTLPTCTRTDVLNASASYPLITVTVSVAANATSPKVNSVTVSTTALESNSGNNSATDSTVILVPPDLTVTKTHAGSFVQGQIGVTYTATVTNSGGGDKLAGTVVTLTDSPPPGLTITAMSGAGWTCATLPTCTRSDLLAPGFIYPAVTITANVAGLAPSPLVNSITVSSAGFESNTANNTANDSATVAPAPDLTVNKSHVGNFSLGQIGAKYTIIVSNSGGGDKAAGTLVTLTETLPSGLTITGISGAGWTCATLTTCTRSDALASGVGYPSVTVSVNVAAAASSPQINSVSVTTAATESNAVNNLGTDSTTIVTGTMGSLTVSKNGSGAGTVASLDGGIACGATCTFAYVNGSNILLTATPAVGSVFTGWLGPCTGTASCEVPVNGAATVNATFALASIGTRILDVDANSAYLPESDGLLIMRYLLGLRGSALTTGATGTGASRTSDPQLPAYLLDILPYLDVDGNGKVDALTDGLMIMRKLLGLTGTAITQGAMGVGATRTPADIEAYIQTLKPP